MIFSLALVSCSSDEDESGTVEINFRADWGANAMVLNEDVWYFNDETMNFSKVNLFLSDITLKGPDGDLVLSEAEFFDFSESNRTEASAEAGITKSYEVDLGEYDSVSFGIGVSPTLNAIDPSDFNNDHPLAQFGSYWLPWKSFIFSKTEGMIDSDGDDVADLAFVYHIGNDVNYRTKEVSGPIKISDGNTRRIDLTIDYKKVFGDMDEHVDIIEHKTIHSTTDPVLIEVTKNIADNFVTAISVEMK